MTEDIVQMPWEYERLVEVPQKLVGSSVETWKDTVGTDDDYVLWDGFLQGRVALWYFYSPDSSLIAFLGMTKDEYADWVVGAVVRSRIKRIWSNNFCTHRDKGWIRIYG